MLEDQVEAQRLDTITRSSLNLIIVATVVLDLPVVAAASLDALRTAPKALSWASRPSSLLQAALQR
jgi:hypothetical protein